MLLIVDAIVLVLGYVLYYLFIPAINLCSAGFALLLLIVGVVLILANVWAVDDFDMAKIGIGVGAVISVIAFIVLVIGGISSCPLFRARDYANVINPENVVKKNIEDYTPSIDSVPLMDSATAELLANRTMGTLVDEVSQYTLGTSTQINYQGQPIRVVPLEYAGFTKWLNNKEVGIPAYITVDMQTSKTEIHYLEHGMRYSTSGFFGDNLERMLRFKYPGELMGTPVFEIDDNGEPFWIVPLLKRTVGLYGGDDVKGILIVDAVRGNIDQYSLSEVPLWVDNVYPSDMLITHYNWYGEYQDGFWNSILGQKGVINTTEGYNYIPKDDDVYMYTGVTSVVSDESNIGFIFVNKRTHEYEYYEVPGAEEYSAMDSAMGQIQHLGYQASFPLLLQIEGQPTYCMALKDAGGLVKMYGLVNMTEYNIVVTGETIKECQTKYREALKSNGQSVIEIETDSLNGRIEDIKTANIDGTTWLYIKLEGRDFYYALCVTDNQEAALLDVGDLAVLNVEDGDGLILPAYLDSWQKGESEISEPEPEPLPEPDELGEEAE